MNRLIKYWSPVVLWCCLIFYFSSIPHLATPWGIWDTILRKGAHILEYVILTLLLIRAFHKTTNLSLRNIFAWSLRLSIFYALTDEIHQGFVPGRNTSVYDLFVDSLGVIFAIWLFTSKEIITNTYE